MTGVERGSMLTASALISTETDDGQAGCQETEKSTSFFRDLNLTLTKPGMSEEGGTYWQGKPGEAGCGSL